MQKRSIKISVENIFPLIKKFLYSDHEIFLRELISNATDATLKLKHLTQIGKVNVKYENPIIEVKVDKKNKKIYIIDVGIGMSIEEIDKYINQIAFSGAEEFMQKYKATDSGVIGHFGLGFYSAFIVAKKVEIISKSYQDCQAAHWICDGSPEFSLQEHTKTDRGTEIILHIAEDSEEFLEEDKIQNLLVKYNKFIPIPIKFGTKKKPLPKPEDAPKNYITEYEEVDNIINNTQPIWLKNPIDLNEQDYKNFYHELYPMQFEEPIFNIHLNVNYPFNLTGILYFPKFSQNMQIQKDKIQLYKNQVFVTDNVEGIVPDFLTMLRGVIDSSDITLNVSRSYLQYDKNIKKISNYITKKVSDKLISLYKDQKQEYIKKWNDIKIVIEYGIISDNNFFERADKFALYPTLKNEYFLIDEYIEKIKPFQTDKDLRTILLYASDKEAQYSFIEEAHKKGYKVLLLDSPIASHLIQKLEMNKKNIQFSRVDSDSLENLIKKEENRVSKLSQDQQKNLKYFLEKIIPIETYTIQLEPLEFDSIPLKIVQPEFIRRIKEQSELGGGTFRKSNSSSDVYQLIVNSNSNFSEKILNFSNENERNEYIKNAFNLAKLSQNLLKGEELSRFIKSCFQKL